MKRGNAAEGSVKLVDNRALKCSIIFSIDRSPYVKYVLIAQHEPLTPTPITTISNGREQTSKIGNTIKQSTLFHSLKIPRRPQHSSIPPTTPRNRNTRNISLINLLFLHTKIPSKSLPGKLPSFP